MDTLVGKIRRVLNRDIPILILGETGTGKKGSPAPSTRIQSVRANPLWR